MYPVSMRNMNGLFAAGVALGFSLSVIIHGDVQRLAIAGILAVCVVPLLFGAKPTDTGEG